MTKFGIAREERLCKLGCGTVGNLSHFLNGCTPISCACVGLLDRYGVEAEITASHLACWRAKARKLECRWRERAKSVARLETEPENPADAQDDAVQRQVDSMLEQHLLKDPEISTARNRKKTAAASELIKNRSDVEWFILAWRNVIVSVRYRLSSGLWVEHMIRMGYFDLSILFEFQYLVILFIQDISLYIQ